jgi:hypothetical protein
MELIKMSYNIIKTMKDKKTGKTINVLLLDGLSSILEIKKLDKALNMAHILNTNSDSNWWYFVRGNGKTYDKELAILTHKKKN